VSVRSAREIRAVRDRYWDKVWWYRHQELKKGYSREQLIESERAAHAIEAKYGLERLLRFDFDDGLMSGRLSALSWVLGSEWDQSLDT
jgi:hypothetical protein